MCTTGTHGGSLLTHAGGRSDANKREAVIKQVVILKAEVQGWCLPLRPVQAGHTRMSY